MKNRNLIFIISIFLTSSQLYGQSKLWDLEMCIEYAKENNKELLSQTQRMKLSEFEVKNSKSKLIPEIEGTVELNHYWAIPVQVFPGELVGQPAGTYIPVELGTPFMGNIGVQANWTILDPSLYQKIKEKELQEQVSNYKLESVQQSLIRNVRMAYYQSILKGKQVENTKKELDNYTITHDLINQKFDKGLTDKITVNQSKSILNSIRQNLTNAKLEQQKALLSLKFWMAYPMNDTIKLISIPTLETAWSSKASFSVEYLPDYHLQKSEVLLAKQKLKYIHSQLYPSLSIQAGYSKLGFGDKLNFVTEQQWFNSGFVGLNLTVPLFSFSKHIYQPKKQKALIEAMELEFEEYQEEARKKFLNEKMALAAALIKVNTQEEQVQLAKENLQLSREKIEKGIVDMISLKQIFQDLNKAQERLYSARLEALQHHVALDYLQQNNLK